MINMRHVLAIFWLLIGGGCLGMAAYMKLHEVPDWGWFLIAGLAILAGITLKDNVTINDEEEDDGC